MTFFSVTRKDPLKYCNSLPPSIYTLTVSPISAFEKSLANGVMDTSVMDCLRFASSASADAGQFPSVVYASSIRPYSAILEASVTVTGTVSVGSEVTALAKFSESRLIS